MVPPRKNRNLPEHLVHCHLLPRLPCKILKRFKCISKSFNSLITADEQFAADQACSSHVSSGCFVYMSGNRLSFFPDQTFIGVPDPSLGFLLPSTSSVVKLVTATNGLLLLSGKFRGEICICVCNPVTREVAFISNADRDMTGWYEKGLVYDPCQSPHRFIIVELLFSRYGNERKYQFDVFHSDTGEWNHSSQMVYMDSSIYVASEPGCEQGDILELLKMSHVVRYGGRFSGVNRIANDRRKGDGR